MLRSCQGDRYLTLDLLLRLYHRFLVRLRYFGPDRLSWALLLLNQGQMCVGSCWISVMQ